MAVDPRNRTLFASILNQDLSRDNLTRLASDLEGFEVVGLGEPTQSGQLRVIIGKPRPDGMLWTRTIKTRKEKNGWKVMDLGKQEVRTRSVRRSQAPGGPMSPDAARK